LLASDVGESFLYILVFNYVKSKINPHIKAAQGAILSIGAPFGWLLIRMFQGATPIDELSAKKVAVTVSLGLTKLKTGDDDKSFLERADTALYQAKQRVVVG
jgi:GGDEF domain-containing protein